MKIHHQTVKKAKKHGITLAVVENDIVASKDGKTLASGLIGNKVLDEAIAKLPKDGLFPTSPEKGRKLRSSFNKVARKAARDEDADDEEEADEDEGGEFDGDPDGDGDLDGEEVESHSIIKPKYKTRYKPFKMTNGDDIARQIREHVCYKDEDTKRIRMDYDKFLRFAKANGCWDPNYKTLNHGQQRMNVVNRLRGKIRRDKHQIVWPT